MKKTNDKLRKMTFVAMYVAFAIVLDYVKRLIPFSSIWSNGGSIDISLIPLAFASFHLGIGYGVLTCVLEQIVAFLLGVTKLYIAPNNPVIGILGDYIIPCIIIGFVSIFFKNNKEFTKKNVVWMELGITICMLIRIFAQTISGVFAWPSEEAIGTWPTWLYSIEYNASFGIPTLITLLIILPILYRVFSKNKK